jgi:hypothetical protein
VRDFRGLSKLPGPGEGRSFACKRGDQASQNCGFKRILDPSTHTHFAPDGFILEHHHDVHLCCSNEMVTVIVCGIEREKEEPENDRGRGGGYLDTRPQGVAGTSPLSRCAQPWRGGDS